MASHLMTAGYPLSLYDVQTVDARLVEQGGRLCESAKKVASESDVVIIMVPDTPHVEAVLFDKDGVCGADIAGKTIIDMSSIDALATQKFAEKVAAKGGRYIDAPVSGGEVGAKEATLTIMAGGDRAVFAEVRPLFEVMGKNITLVGASGCGQIAKIANQIIVALTIEAVSEALLFASKAGADPEAVRQALLGGFASSRILELHGKRMTSRKFEPGFRIGLHQKDLNLALQGAQALGIALPNTAVTQQQFQICAAHGGAAWDHSALIRALEIASNHEIGGASESEGQ